MRIKLGLTIPRTRSEHGFDEAKDHIHFFVLGYCARVNGHPYLFTASLVDSNMIFVPNPRNMSVDILHDQMVCLTNRAMWSRKLVTLPVRNECLAAMPFALHM